MAEKCIPRSGGVHPHSSVFSGKFDAQALEQALNTYANDGWHVAQGFTAASVWKSAKTEIFVILEREMGEAGAKVKGS